VLYPLRHRATHLNVGKFKFFNLSGHCRCVLSGTRCLCNRTVSVITSAIAHAFVARRWLLLRQLFIAGLMFTFCNSKLPFFSQTPVIGLFFSPFLGRLFWINLIEWISNVRPSTRSFVDFYEIWHVGRGRWVMHEDMQYDPIQGQGHVSFKVGNPSIFNSYLICHLQWDLGAGNWPQTLKLGHNI